MRQGKGLSRHADSAKAFAYGTKRWRAFNRFLYDGQLEPDNLIAERVIRGFTMPDSLCCSFSNGGKQGFLFLVGDATRAFYERSRL
ncbi:transposase [Mesorhizobium sp. M0085]